ncbi:hypothetical protein [Bacillus licheniformis]|uniref:hypothetical protein n=1 Tax=Bacillus licheniformis TaxID=1402 RepID=UPI00092A6537|nr:hypothetical protein [Bacillus licheniformis]OJT66901.1 hypothetical protein BFP46_22855 [Bacillus licheniformis]
MGYNTTFQGQFRLNKTLDSETYSFLKKLANTRRMRRKVNESIYGIEGEFYVDGRDHDENIIDGNEPPKTQPSLWLQWIPTEERNAIVWDGEEKFYCADKWIIYLIEKVLKPKGYVLNGIVNAFGEETNDIWHISIVNNHVSIGNGEIELATCSNCGFSYEVVEINMVDYEDDLCVNCEKQVKEDMDNPMKLTKEDNLKIAINYPGGDHNFSHQELDEMNIKDARHWIEKGEMVAIVSEIHGGIVGYIHKGHADDFVTILNLYAIERLK